MRKSRLLISSYLVVFLVAAASVALAFYLKGKVPAITGEEGASWAGMDEVVVEKYAAEHGREARRPLLPVEEGDVPLFLFCLAGFAGGCLVGYTWRRIFAEGRPRPQNKGA